jgi:hypothetical protein
MHLVLKSCVHACSFRRPQDIVDVLFVATKDPVKENEWAEQYRRYLEANKVCVVPPAHFFLRVGQNHIYTVYIRYFWQGNH